MKSFKAMAVLQRTISDIQIMLNNRQINREVEVGKTRKTNFNEPKYGTYRVTAK